MEASFSYVYIYLDPRKPGNWEYQGITFDHQPFYVGKGVGCRIKDHLLPSSLRATVIKSNIINKIIRNGLEPIYFKIFENLTESEAIEIEIKIIAHFGRIDKSTGILANMTNGGVGALGRTTTENQKLSKPKNRFTKKSKGVDQFDLCGNFIKRWDCPTDIEKSLGFFASQVCACCNQRRKTYKGFVWKYNGILPYTPDDTKKNNSRVFSKVYCYSKDGHYQNSFATASDFLKGLRLNYSASSVYACCREELYMIHGFQVFNEFKGDKIYSVDELKFNEVNVFCVSVTNEFGEIVNQFQNSREAAKHFAIKLQPFVKMVKKKTNYKGFVFDFIK